MADPFSHICVFCGASDGARPDFRSAAVKLGSLIARRRMTLVYGGGSMGLMGAVADAALDHGGKVIGVITKLLHSREVAHLGLAELQVVDTMHDRKRLMNEQAQGFVVLPGGFGTFEELFEIIAWAQLGIHHKPVGLVNTARYYDGLMEFLDHAAREGFLRLSHREQVFCAEDPEELLGIMSASVGPPPARAAGRG